MSSFNAHIIGKGGISELAVVAGITEGKKISLVIACDSPLLTATLLNRIFDQFDSCDVTISTSPRYEERAHVPLFDCKVCILGGTRAPSPNTLREMVQDFITQIPIEPVYLVKDVHEKLHDQVSPYGPQKRKAFRGK
jgi:hypothetical protein